jgi:hypothetical protein
VWYWLWRALGSRQRGRGRKGRKTPLLSEKMILESADDNCTYRMDLWYD